VEASRKPKSAEKAAYNRSYVRGFARPPPPPTETVEVAAPADSSSPPPPPFLAAEDDPTSNHYQAPIFRQPLSLTQLLDICSDPMILSSLPTPGVHVTRLTAQGKPREYVMYRCSVCGKEVGDKSKHKKHEASCKKRILKMLNMAEKDEEDRKNPPPTVEASQQVDEKEKVKEERKRRKVVGVLVAASHTAAESPVSSRQSGEPSVSKPRQQAIEKSEIYQMELKKQLKWIWHTMDVNPATCLLSRDSVLARIDLTQLFTAGADGYDLFGLLSAEEQESLVQYLPQMDQEAAMRGDSKGAVKQEFPPSRTEAVHSTLRSTLASPVFVRSLEEYKGMLMGGSLDPALKGLRMMAAARRRRQQREAEPNKQTESEAYWGEKLSEVRVNAAKPALGKNGRALLGGWRGLLGKKHKAVPAGPSGTENGHAEDGRHEDRHGNEEEEQEQEYEEGMKDEADADEQSDRTASDTDIDNRASEGTDDERKSAEGEDEEETNGYDEDEQGGRRPLHRTRHRPAFSSHSKRGRRTPSSSSRPPQRRPRSNSEQSSDSSSYSPLHIDSLLPLPLQLKLPTASLPDVVPSIQRFHMRSPRFRRVRYARFVLKDGRNSLIPARNVATATSPTPSRQATTQKQRGSRDSAAQPLSPAAFSHMPRSIEKQCMQLQRRMMSADEKQAAQQRIRQARSVRVRQIEQDRLNAALEAETQLLQLVETTASETSSARRKDRRREREDEERQQRAAHGMKRPRGLYEDEESGQSLAASAEDEDGQYEQIDREQEGTEDDEIGAAGDTSANSKQPAVSSDDDEEPLSRRLGNNGAGKANSETRLHSEEEDAEGEDDTQVKTETHLYTPVFSRGKFGFSSFIKQAVGNQQ